MFTLKLASRAKDFYVAHSPFFESAGYLVVNTALLASKIFDRFPVVITYAAKGYLNFSGLLWMGTHVQDWTKNVRDLRFALHYRNYPTALLTAARCCVKALNIFLTLSSTAAFVLTVSGFPLISAQIYAVIAPLGMIGWLSSVSGAFIDYAENRKMLKQLDALEQRADADQRVQAFVQDFIAFSFQSVFKPMEYPDDLETPLAMKMVRQMEYYHLHSLKADLQKKGLVSTALGKTLISDKDKSWEVFRCITGGIKKTQQSTKGNILLIALGYVSWGLGRAFPDTIVQYGTYWGMSLLYTIKLVYTRYLK
jgi:hypothetical protein